MMNKELDKLEKELTKLHEQSVKEVAKNFTRANLDIKKHISWLYERFGLSNGQIDFIQLNKYNRIETFKKAMALTIVDAYNTNKKLSRETIRDIVDTSYKESIKIARKGTKLPLKAIQKQSFVTDIVNKDVKGYTWLERMDMDRQDALMRIERRVVQGIADGDTYSTVSKKLAKEMNISIGKAETIVRTETTRSRGETKLITLQDLDKQGVEVEKEWQTVKDEAVRSQHADLDGKIIGVNEYFEIGNDRALAPGQFSEAKNNINCRCILLTKIGENRG